MEGVPQGPAGGGQPCNDCSGPRCKLAWTSTAHSPAETLACSLATWSSEACAPDLTYAASVYAAGAAPRGAGERSVCPLAELAEQHACVLCRVVDQLDV